MESLPMMNLHSPLSFQPESQVLFSAFGKFLILCNYPVNFNESQSSSLIALFPYEATLESKECVHGYYLR